MSVSPTSLAVLIELPATALHGLSDALSGGVLKHGVSSFLLSPFVGNRSGEIAALFKRLLDEGCPAKSLSEICLAMAVARDRLDESEKSLFLTLSGPEVVGTPVVDTATMVRALFEEASHDVILTSYVFSYAREMLAPLVTKHDADDSFRVRIVTDLSHQRKRPEEPLPVIANRFRSHFLEQYWTGHRAPELWHDPRVFKPEPGIKPGVMHAKVVIIDHAAALITSANFTEAAQARNIEAGVLLRHPRQVKRIRDYFDGLINERFLVGI